MKPQEVVQADIDKMAARDLDASALYLADDFQFSGPIPEPVGKAQYVGLLKTMSSAFPDIDMHARIVGAEGNVVKATHQLTGTHTAALDLSALGMGVIPATGKSFSMAVEPADYTVRGDKIASIHVHPTEGAGLMAILSKLGVAVPAK